MRQRDIHATGFDEDTGKAIELETCPECEGDLLTEGGEVNCIECGLIVTEYRIDPGPKTRLFDGEKRTGAPITPSRHDRGVSAEIGYVTDGNGRPLSEKKRRQVARLRREHNRARWGSKANRNLGEGFSEITRVIHALDLSRSARDRACAFFRRSQEENLLVGRSIEAMAAASVYAACRSDGYLRTIEEVLAVARCERSRVLNAYRTLNVELGVEAKPRRPIDFVPRFASAVDASDSVRSRAYELASVAMDVGIDNGRNPAGIAAACLYAAGRELGADYTQAELAEIADVSDITIRKRYYELRAELGK